MSKMNVLILKFMIVCIDCFKLFQTISNKNQTMVREANESLRTERDVTLRHPGKKCILHTFSKDNKVRLLRFSLVPQFTFCRLVMAQPNYFMIMNMRNPAQQCCATMFLTNLSFTLICPICCSM